MRVPVITTSDGGECAEVVKENEGGQLVRYGDTTALSKAIMHFYEDETCRDVQGDRGRDRVERLFTSTTMFRRYAALYCDLKQKQ